MTSRWSLRGLLCRSNKISSDVSDWVEIFTSLAVIDLRGKATAKFHKLKSHASRTLSPSIVNRTVRCSPSAIMSGLGARFSVVLSATRSYSGCARVVRHPSSITILVNRRWVSPFMTLSSTRQEPFFPHTKDSLFSPADYMADWSCSEKPGRA
jgi:hypothetical protein